MNFQEHSITFLARLTARKRNPVKPATLKTYGSLLGNHILPAIGQVDMKDFANGAMRDFAQALTDKGLSPKTVLEVTGVVKQMFATATDGEGDSLYPRKWNHEFIDLPTIGRQKQPGLRPEQLAAALASDLGVFYAFLAGTGLRIGEALATRYGCDGAHTGWQPDNACVSVRTSLWRGQEQTPKTQAALRTVDLDPRLNDLLVFQAASNTIPEGDFLFRGVGGNHLGENYVRVYSLQPLGIPGFHTFRRWRITHLREQGVPEDIIRFWVGHAGAEVTDRYSKLAENAELRQEWAKKAGLGFDFPNKEITA